MNIQPIVEGHGEVEALPVLLRRLVTEAQVWSINIGRPIRRKRNQLMSEAEVNTAVKLARLQSECCAVLILFDGDSDCPAELGPQVQHWAAASACNLPFIRAFGSFHGAGYRCVASRHLDRGCLSTTPRMIPLQDIKKR